MFKDGDKVIYKQLRTQYGENSIPFDAKGVILKCIEDEMLVDFFEHGKAIVVPSCLKKED